MPEQGFGQLDLQHRLEEGREQMPLYSEESSPLNQAPSCPRFAILRCKGVADIFTQPQVLGRGEEEQGGELEGLS